jgi:GTP cyclohydrolase II
VWKHCSNPQCFVRKVTAVILNQLNIKKIKLTNNFDKNHNKKTMLGNIKVIHSVLNKRNYKTKFLTNLILQK